MNQKRTFAPRAIALDDEDAKLAAYARENNIPDLVSPVATAEAAPAAAPAPAAPSEPDKPVNVGLPGYVVTALKMNAATGKGPIRHQLLQALSVSGLVEVREADLLVADRRGRKPAER